MVRDNPRGVVEALNAVIQVLSRLDDKSRDRVLNSVSIFFGHGAVTSGGVAPIGETQGRPAFSDDSKPSPKEFLFQKKPKTDVERIACLAFYLTHYLNTQHFKTLDLAKLNTEAAQIKFSNAHYATENATKAGYLAPAAKAYKQITAWGEQFVAALPDREAAQKIIAQARKRKSTRKKR